MISVPLDVNTILTIAMFVVNAMIGAVAYIFFWSVKDRNAIIRHIVLAGIAGYIYWNMHSSYDVPNAVVVVVIGWFAPDFINALMDKLKPKASSIPSVTPNP